MIPCAEGLEKELEIKSGDAYSELECTDCILYEKKKCLANGRISLAVLQRYLADFAQDYNKILAKLVANPKARRAELVNTAKRQYILIRNKGLGKSDVAGTDNDENRRDAQTMLELFMRGELREKIYSDQLEGPDRKEAYVEARRMLDSSRAKRTEPSAV